MALLIRIERSTTKFIAELNGGIEPLVTEFPSMFIYYGINEGKLNEIISLETAIELFKDDPTVQPHTIEYCVFDPNRKKNKD